MSTVYDSLPVWLLCCGTVTAVADAHATYVQRASRGERRKRTPVLAAWPRRSLPPRRILESAPENQPQRRYLVRDAGAGACTRITTTVRGAVERRSVHRRHNVAPTAARMLRNRLALATLLVLQVGWFVGAVAPQARQLQLIVPEAGCDTDMIDDLTEDLNRACCPAATCHDAAPTRCSAGCALAMATAFGGGCRDTLGRLSEAVTTLWQVCLALPPEEVAAAIAPTCGGAVPLPPPPPTPPPPPPPPRRPPPPPPAPVFSGGCTSYPCQNGGQCVEEAGAVYRCQCTTGFAGDDCEDNQSSSADDQISHDTADDRCYPCPHYVPNGNEIPCDDWMVGCMVQCSDCSCQSTAGTCPRPAGGGHRRTQAGGSRTEAILEAYTGDAATACAAIGMAPADGAKGAGDACCGAGTSLYVTASSDCLRGEWILGA